VCECISMYVCVCTCMYVYTFMCVYRHDAAAAAVACVSVTHS
jgi:hypothetical protein